MRAGLRRGLIAGCLSFGLASCVAPVRVEPREVTFVATVGATLFADVYANPRGPEAPVVLLFHQGGGDARGEYGPIIPRLLEHRLNVVAFDLRGGGERFGVMNRTVAKLPRVDPPYCDEYPDMEAALDFTTSSGFTGPQIIWGSSYSASLGIRLAADHPEQVAAVLAFSPASGGPMEPCKPDPHIARLEAPLLVLRPASELALPAVQQQSELVRRSGHTVYEADPGTHGSSMLVAERAGGDVEFTWERVLSFIDESIRR